MKTVHASHTFNTASHTRVETHPNIKMQSLINTKFLIVSDTHAGKGLTVLNLPVGVAIHCGDLTNESKISEFRTTLGLLRSINAPLKLVIAGNHDFTLDTSMFIKKTTQAQTVLSIEPELIKKTHGDLGEARKLFEDAKADGVIFLMKASTTSTSTMGQV